MSRYLTFALFILVACVAMLPLVSVSSGGLFPWLSPNLIAALNLLGWSLLIAFVFSRKELHRGVAQIADNLGIDTRFKSLENLLNTLLREVNRKNSSLSINLIERRITSKEELSRTFERIVALTFKLLEAESAELALFDKESGLYHSSFVLGKPFRVSSQAMLSGAVEGEEIEMSPDVLIQPIAFAGSVLGTLRVALKRGTLPSVGDQEIMRLLALQSSIAMINAQYTSELVRMKQTSEESVKAKTGFLANLSHEIRGPLGIIMNAVELVLDGLCGPINADQLETLRMVHSNGEHLLELINDVLDYAKVESGKIVPEKTDILVDDLLRDITEVVRVQAEAKSHKLSFKSSNEALGISCDRRHARQMMINLLTNAIKYTPDGGMIEVWAERAPGNKIKINVRDSGVGIEESDRRKVFAAFERVEHGYSIRQLGTGLGMPLTKRLAEVNGGTVDFSSMPNKGSHFWIVFPAIEVKTHIIHEDATKKAPALGKGESILLIEKEDNERSMISRYLTHIGFNVSLASSKLESIEITHERKIDLAIIDNGILDDSTEENLIQLIREKTSAASLPIILLSSRGFIFDIEKYLRAGIDRCLVKPVPLKELGDICRALIDGKYTGPVLDEQAKEAVPADGKKKKDAAQKPTRLDDIYH